MVDALHEARRILVARGVFVDARPESRVHARVRAGSARGRVIGTIATQRPAMTDDRLSDRAIQEALRLKLFHPRRHGRLWHTIPFRDSAALNEYLREHLRFSSRVSWTVPAARRTEPFFIERAVRFEILEKL
jgi:hypothetical protein